MQHLDSTFAPERKLELRAPYYNVIDGEQFIGSIICMEYGWLAIDTDEEPCALCGTRAEAAIWLQKNFYPIN